MLEKLVHSSGDGETGVRGLCNPFPYHGYNSASLESRLLPTNNGKISNLVLLFLSPPTSSRLSYYPEKVALRCTNTDKDVLPHIIAIAYREQNNGQIGSAETAARFSMGCQFCEGVIFAMANPWNWNCCIISVLISKFWT